MHDPALVALSVAIAVFAAYTALDLASSVAAARGRARLIWLAGGAVALGAGLWSMHFVGALAVERLRLAPPARPGLLLLTLVLAVAAAVPALLAASRRPATGGTLLAAGTALAALSAALHYLWVSAAHPGEIDGWRPATAAGALALGVAGCWAGLGVGVPRREARPGGDALRQLGGALIVGVALIGAHYGSTAAVRLRPAAPPTDFERVAPLGIDTLAGLVAGASTLILGIAVAGAVMERALARSTASAEEHARRFRDADAAREHAERQAGGDRAAREEALTILDRISDAFFALDRDAHFVYVNRAAREFAAGLAGREPEEMVGRSFWDVAPDTRGTALEAALRRAIQEQVAVHFEEFIARWGRWLEVHAYPSPDGVSVYFRDVTERKQAEGEQRFLAETGRILTSSLDFEETLRAVARLAVAEVADGCLIYIREEERLRVVASAYAGRSAASLRRPPTDHPALAPGGVLGPEAAIESGEPELLADLPPAAPGPGAGAEEVHALREMGVRSILTAPLVARGRTLGALRLVSTRHGRRYGEEDLALAAELASRAALAVDNARLFRETEARARDEAALRAELEGVMRSRARLIRGFSHDVKNPLAAADGYLQLLETGLQGPLEPKQRESLTRVRRSLRAAVRLIDDLLDLARVEAGQLEVASAPMDVRAVVLEMVDEYQAQAEASDLSLSVEVPDELPMVRSDAARVRQILGNLLSNAVKYTPRGGRVGVRAGERRDGAPRNAGRFVAVDVTDTGGGVPAERQEHIFLEFTRLEPGQQPGSGLGLAISRRLARALGGELSVDSVPGRGSAFTLWLPVRDA